MNTATRQEIGLTHEDFAILCRADEQSPTLIKMIVGDTRDAKVMLACARDRQALDRANPQWPGMRSLHRGYMAFRELAL